MTETISVLQKERAKYAPKLPPVFRHGLAGVGLKQGPATTAAGNAAAVKALFPNCYGQPMITFQQGGGSPATAPLNVAVVLSGGQAPGGHNVISGLLDGLKSLNPASRLLGFLGGPKGLIDNDWRDLTAEVVDAYRNTGGFDIIGSGRTKLESEEQFAQVLKTCQENKIAAVVIIGGDDSNTNACVLAEWLKAKGEAIQVIGAPKTIDGDLRNEQIEMSFGFDTAAKVYSELIGNICRDANSARKYWHFIKLMGRSASHITLEAALQTQPNVALISEEVAKKEMTLHQVVEGIVAAVAGRAKQGKDFGIVLVPEGLIEFIPEIKNLIKELNDILAAHEKYFNSLKTFDERGEFINGHLGRESAAVFNSLPAGIREQLTLDRDAHGNVQVSRIETEKLLAEMAQRSLSEMKSEGAYKGKFSVQTHFLGYEGRCAQPTNFDADYSYSLGCCAAALAASGLTGYMACVRNLIKPAGEWQAAGVPLTLLMTIERRHGKDKPVIEKALTDLEGKPFAYFAANRREWADGECYLYPGPIQYFGPSEVCDAPNKTIVLERA